MAPTARVPWIHVVALVLLFVLPVVSFEQIFGGGVGLLAAGAGVVVGLAIAVISTWRRWDWLATTVVVAASYLVVGGLVAARPTLLFGFLPSLRTVQLLAGQAVDSWKDLLTVEPPAGAYLGLAVLPWLVGLASSVIAGLLALRSRRRMLAMVPVIVMGVIGIAWGPGGVHPASWPTLLWVVGVLAWVAWQVQLQRVGTGEEVLVGRRALGPMVTEQSLPVTLTSTGGRPIRVVHTGRKVIAGLVTLSVAATLTFAVTGAWSVFDSRTVLRDLVQPPLDTRDYPTPLAAFRHYTTDLAKETLVTASSMPQGSRVRLGVMDTYNGIAFGMSDPQRFSQGRYAPFAAVDGAATGEPIQVTTSKLTGPWLPTLGSVSQVTFAGDRSTELSDGLFYNSWANAALTTAKTDQETSYLLRTTVTPPLSDGQLEGANPAALGGTPDTGVPSEIADLAQSVVAKESTALGRARTIERYLSKEGAFSNSNSAQARSGHRADRLIRMLAGKQMIGDDEQYATLMALMLRSLDLPARVVVGLYPGQYPASGAVTLRGSDVHAWVEVEFAGVGWGVFDPTPPRDQVPQTEELKPKSIPKPQVLQPPDPPEEPAELPPAVSDQTLDRPEDNTLVIPWVEIGWGLLGVIVLVGPFVAIAVVKGRRMRRRRRALEPSVSITGAWNETVDRAVDAGVPVPKHQTRQEAATALAAVWPGSFSQPEPLGWYVAGVDMPPVIALARLADTAVFAPAPVSAVDAAQAWSYADELQQELDRPVSRWTRLRRRLSLRSLRRAAAPRQRWPLVDRMLQRLPQLRLPLPGRRP